MSWINSSKLLNLLHRPINWFKRGFTGCSRVLIIKNFVYIALFILGPIISGFLIGDKMFMNYLPTGDDPGNWLKRINAFLGNTYPLWNEDLSSYPPLFPFLGALLTFLIGDSVVAMKALAILVFMLIPITSGLFAYKVSGSKWASAMASLITSLLPMHYEMIWWGAYPNLLGIALLPVGVYAIIRIIEGQSSKKDLAYLVIITVFITLTHHMTAVVFAGVLIIVVIMFLALKILSFRFMLAILISLNVIIAYTIYLITFGYLIRNPVVEQVDLYDRLLWTFKNPFYLYILATLSILGIVKLVLTWRYFLAIILSAWIISPVLLALSQYIGVAADVGRFLLFLGIPITIASTVTAPNLKEIVKVTKVSEEYYGKEPIYSLEISMDKFLITILIFAVLILTPVITLSTNDSAYEYYDWLSKDYRKYSDQERLQVLGWIRDNTDTKDLIVASYHLGRWIEGYSSRRTLMDIPLKMIMIKDELYRSLSAQAILLSNYVVTNGYFKIDDQSPLTPTFAPLIYVSNEWCYDPILYLDDSFVRFVFERGGRTWMEAPFNSWLYIYSIDKHKEQTTITLSYQSIALRINKTLEISQNTPYFKIRYDVSSTTEAKLNEAQITFFLAWWKIIKRFNATSNGFRLSTGTGEIIVEFDKNLTRIEAEIYEEFNQHRVLITLPLSPRGDSFTITFRNPNNVLQYPQNWFMSFERALEDFDVKYIVLPKDHPFHKTRTWTPPYPSGEVAYIQDAFVRVNFTKAGAGWVEAPYMGNVTQEEITVDGRMMTYETMGLIFHKEVKNKNGELTVFYKAEPKPGVQIESIELSIWQSWGREVPYVNVSGHKTLIVSDAGSIQVEADKEAILQYGLDREFNMPRILIFKKSVNNKAEITINIKPLNYLSSLKYMYLPTTRPKMEGGDYIYIVNQAIKFEPVFETENIVIYEVKWT